MHMLACLLFRQCPNNVLTVSDAEDIGYQPHSNDDPMLLGAHGATCQLYAAPVDTAAADESATSSHNAFG